MTRSEPARTTTRRSSRILPAGQWIVIVTVVVALAYQALASSPSTAASHADGLLGEHAGALTPPLEQGHGQAPRHGQPAAPASGPERPGAPVPDNEQPGALATRGEHPGVLAETDGAVPDGTTVLDDGTPGVANLDPALLRALRRAAADAADDGVEIFVNSGWRSRKYQEELFHRAVARYGSEREAARWVAPPDASAHVSGDAVDVGPFAATAWLAEHGARYGLCPIYANEPWHYELRRKAVDNGCPRMYADPTHDPRMRR